MTTEGDSLSAYVPDEDVTRYVTPEEFGVGTHYVAGCPSCGGRGTRWYGRCLFCKGWKTALYEKQPDGSFRAKRVRRI